MAMEVGQRTTTNGASSPHGGIGHEMDMDNDTLLSRTEQRPLTLSRRRIFYQAPEFIQRLSGEEVVVEGLTARFECTFKGFPKPTVTWFKDEVPLDFDSRISVEPFGQGSFALVIRDVVRSDEATYRCQIVNNEGSCSSTLYLSVKGSSRSPKQKKSLSPNRRMVSYPSLFPTIEERVVEEEKAEEEVKKQEPSPLTKLYDGNKLRSRHTWPKFVGDWAFADDEEAGPSTRGDGDVDFHGGPFCMTDFTEDDDVFADNIPADTDTLIQAGPFCVSNPYALHSTLLDSESNFRFMPDVKNSSFLSPSNDPSSYKDPSGNSSGSTFSQKNSFPCQSEPKNIDMDLYSTDKDRDQSLVGHLRHWSGDTPEDSSVGELATVNNKNFVTDTNQIDVSKKKQPPPKGQRKRPPRKPMDNIGGLLATSFMLSSFTFCALCLDTSPEIFIVAIFIAAFMFQVIQQLNAM